MPLQELLKEAVAKLVIDVALNQTVRYCVQVVRRYVEKRQIFGDKGWGGSHGQAGVISPRLLTNVGNELVARAAARSKGKQVQKVSFVTLNQRIKAQKKYFYLRNFCSNPLKKILKNFSVHFSWCQFSLVEFGLSSAAASFGSKYSKPCPNEP